MAGGEKQLNNIDKRIVEMQFENGKFERDIATTLNSINKLNTSLLFNNATKGAQVLTSTFGAITRAKGLHDIKDMISDIGDSLGAGTSKIAQFFMSIEQQAINAAINVAKAFTIQPAVDGWEEYNTKTKSTQTLLNNVSKYGSTMEDVSKVLDELNLYADKTTYSFAGMVQTISGASSSGLNLDQLKDYAIGLSNLAAYSGVDNTALQRAGYQINQALQKGFFQLQDWRSIENANLGTMGFQETLKDVARENGLAIDELIAQQGSFRDSLSQNWLTNDIFLEALNRYGDGTTELGKAAFDSATKTKTFAESMDQVKESLGSGWSKSYEIVIGNMEQAKEFWTTITNTITKFTDSFSTSRNKLLEGWREKGGAEDLIAGIKYGLQALFGIIEKLGQGWNDIFKEMDADTLVKITKDFRVLMAQFDKFVNTTSTFRTIGAGIASVIEGALIIVKGLGIALSPVAGWIKDISIFLANGIIAWANWQKSAGRASNWATEFIKSAEAVRDWIAGIPAFFVKQYNKIKGIFIKADKELLKRGVNIQYIFDSIGAAIKGAFSAIGSIFIKDEDSENTLGFFQMLQSIFSTDNIVNGLVAMGQALATVFNWSKTLGDWWANSKIKAFFDSIGTAISNAMQKLWNVFMPKGADGGPAFSISNMFNGLKSAIENVIQWIADLWNWVKEVLQPLTEILQPVIDSVKKLLGDLYEGFKTALQGVSGSTNADTVVNVGFLGTLIAAVATLAKHLNKLDKIMKSLEDQSLMKMIFGEDIGANKFFEEVDKFFNSYNATQKEARATLRNKSFEIIANSILKLVGAMFILTLIDTDKMASGLLIISGFIVDLLFAMDTMSRIEGLSDEAKILGMTKSLSQMATAVLELAFALKIIDTAKDIHTSLRAVMLILGEFVGALLVLAGLNEADVANLVALIPVMTKLSNSMVKLAAAFRIIATVSPAKDSNEYAKALMGLMAALVGMAIGLGKGITKDQAATLALLPKLLRQLALSTLVLVGAVAILSKLDAESLGRSVIATIALMGVMMMLVEMLAKNAVNAKGITELGGMMILIALAVIALAGAVMMLSTLDNERLGVSIIAIIALMGVLVLLSKEIGASGSGAGLLAAGAGMLLIGAALVIISQAIKMIADLDYLKMSSAVAVMAGIFGIMALMILLTSAVPATGLILLGAALIVLSVGLTGIVAILQALALIKPEQMGSALLGFAGILAVVIIAMAAMGALSPTILIGSVAFLAFAAAIFLLAAAFMLLATALGAIAVSGSAALPIMGLLVTGIIASALQGFTNGLILMLDSLKLLVPKIIETLDWLLEQIRDWIFGKVTFYVESVIKWFIAIIDGLIPNIAELIMKVFELVKEILRGLSEALDQNGDEIAIYIADIVAKLIDMIIKALIELFSRLIDIGYKLGTQIGDGLVKAWPWIKENIITPIENGWNGIKDFFSKFLQAGKDLIDNIVKGIINAPANIKDTITGFIDSAVEWIRNFDFLQVGKDLVGGLLKGIGLNADDIFDAAGNVATGVVDVMKGIFGINSPSKVMSDEIMTDGVFAGLLKGINDNEDSVNNAMSSLGGSMSDNFASSLNITDAISALFGESSPTITPVLDLSYVESGLSDLDGMMPDTTIDFASMAGNSFDLNKYANYQNSVDQQAKMDDILSKMDARDASFAESLNNSSEDIKVYLDNDVLVGELYRGMDSKLGKATTIQRRQ